MPALLMSILTSPTSDCIFFASSSTFSRLETSHVYLQCALQVLEEYVFALSRAVSLLSALNQVR